MVTRGRLSYKSIFLLVLSMLIIFTNSSLAITIIQPTHEIINTLEFDLTISTLNATECFYDYSNKAHENKSYSLTKNSSFFTKEIVETYDADYEYYISCKYNSSNTTQIKETLLKLKIDSKKPSVIDYKPKEVVTQDSYLLGVTLDKPASCKYSINNISYYTMTEELADNGDNTHYKQIDYSFDGKRSYYIDCLDTHGNTLENRYKIVVEHSIPPIGQIIFDKNPPFTQGTYKITLLTSKEVIQTPSLSYTFDGVKQNYIPLTGSKNTWTGYMVINEVEKSNALVGSFNFNSEDLKGTIGNLITKNKIFLVDTKSPERIRNLRAISKENGHIRLVWNYDDLSEEIDYFKIYRSSVNNINKLDYYDKTSREYFSDEAIIPGRTYFYSVSAVDMAGNEGELSAEFEIESILDEELLNEESKPKIKQDPIKTEKISVAKEKINEIISQINSINFEDDNAIDFLRILDLDRLSTESINILTPLIDQLDDAIILEEPEFTKKINDILQKANSQKSKIPLKITFQGTMELISNQNNFEEIIKATLDSYRLEYSEEFEKNYNDFEKSTKDLSNKISTTTKATKIIITYLDTKNKEFLKIDKSVNLDNVNLTNDIFLIEKIPKEIAASTSEIIYDKKSNIEIVRNNPILKIPITNAKEFSYIITKPVSENILQSVSIESYLLLNPLKNYLENEPENNKITGDLIKGNFNIEPNLIFTILGLIMIIGLGGYYFTLDKNISFKDFSIKNIIPKKTNLNQKENLNLQNKINNSQNSTKINETFTNFTNNEPIKNNSSNAVDNLALNKVLELCNTVVTQNYSLINKDIQKPKTQIFQNCHPEKSFMLSNNKKLNNLIDLLECLDFLEDTELEGYLTRNDFSNWVKD